MTPCPARSDEDLHGRAFPPFITIPMRGPTTRRPEDGLVDEDAVQVKADGHEEVHRDVEEAEEGEDRDEIGPLHERYERNEEKREGAREKRVALDVVKRDVPAEDGCARRPEEDHAGDRVRRDEGHDPHPVDDEEKKEHRDGKGQHQLEVARQEKVEGGCAVEQRKADRLFVDLPALLLRRNEKKGDAVKGKDHRCGCNPPGGAQGLDRR